MTEQKKMCKICGGAMRPKDITCIPCLRATKWQKRKPIIMAELFDTRLIAELDRLQIKISATEIENIAINNMGAYLWGATGKGKTLLAAQMLMDTLEYYAMQAQPVSYAFTTMFNLLNEIRAEFDSPNKREAYNKYSTVHVLVIDDMAVDKVTDWMLQTVNALINERYGYYRPTIITSNLDLEGLADYYDERLTSRLYAMCDIMHVDGPDYRLAGK